MAIFNRRNNQAQVPAEIQEYYQSNRRERAGVAWLLAIGTLIVTILLAAGIFFAGRWAWRQIANNDDNQTPETTQNEGQQQQGEGQQPAQENQGDQQGQDQPAADQPSQQTPSTAQDEPASETPATEDEPATGGSGGGTTTPPAASGDETDNDQVATTQSGKTPNTGPGDTLALFLGVSVLGYILHRRFARAK